MKLKKVTIHKYKSFETDQTFDVDDNVTILVGMNESGKTSALEAIAKTRYFQDDKKFKFSTTHDYPRREKKSMDKSRQTPQAITCEYEFEEPFLQNIKEKFGDAVFPHTTITITTDYDNKVTVNNFSVNPSNFIGFQLQQLGIYSSTLLNKLLKVSCTADLEHVIAEYKDAMMINCLQTLKVFYDNQLEWKEPISEYLYRVFITPSLPKFLYYDEYYSLPSRITIEKLKDDNIKEEELKTAKALLELADLKPSDILGANDFEDYIAELEATEAIISDELFEYWSTNKNLSIEFKIEPVEQNIKRTIRGRYGDEEVVDVKIVEHVLDVRVKNLRTRVSLPLKNRSKGFNWFFSFLVWFKKIQEDKNSKYILLLDEPGLNLHASAQSDMLRFIEDLSRDYQILYTTHSPFSIPSNKLERVRTVLETKEGSVISESVQEKDPNTLFPLQAALGYDIAQNLFISPKNLLVEGVSDLIILTTLSGILEAKGRTSLRNDITIVPTGGLEKVATFISLLRGSKLEIVCLLDSYTDAKGKAKMDKIVADKIIHKSKIRFFDEFVDWYARADIEDLFLKEDYLNIFNDAFPEFENISVNKLNHKVQQIIIQINQYLNVERFNHYRPANVLLKKQSMLSEGTLNNFEQLFIDVNKLFD